VAVIFTQNLYDECIDKDETNIVDGFIKRLRFVNNCIKKWLLIRCVAHRQFILDVLQLLV
ncbi:MAG: hypothetical protein JWP67_1343, partial [Mucilaginibacter sp.]|nr:hypothetical protein [Mucilaginibacter sp.]